jgi:hypothetical protein
MKILVILSYAVASALGCCTLVAQDHGPREEQNDRTNLGLQGPVHSSLIVTAQVNPDPRDTNDRHAYYFNGTPWLVFDENGWTIESASQVVDGKPQFATKQKRDKDGGFPESGSRTETQANCEKKETKRYRNGKLESHEVETYYELGWSLHSESFYEDGRLSSETDYTFLDPLAFYESKTYAQDGTVALHWSSRSDDPIDRLDFWQYDPSGRIVLTLTAINQEVISKWRDPQWNQSSPVLLLTRFSHFTTTLVFSERGEVSRTVQHHEGRKRPTEPDDALAFNGNGTLLDKIEYKYTRDGHANWTSRSVLVWDKQTNSMVEVQRDTRTLTYY